jgi:hypothetical protein
MRLASLPGMRNEQMNVRKDDLKWLMDYMERTGKLPPKSSDPNDEYLPFIMVAYNGEAWVNEGNHRIMAAYRLNWPDMPVEIRYFDGGERVASGPMAPGKIGLGPVKEEHVAEDLNEIYKMPPTKDSSQGMTIWAYNDALEKKLPVVHKDKNVTIFKSNEDLLRYIILQDGNPVLYIGFSKFLDGYKSGAVATEIQGRGKGLAQKAYINASDILGVPIYSDSTQTDASRLGIWDKLIQQYPDRIVGYDQKTNKNLPLSVGDKGPIVNQNQPIYVDRNPIDTKKPVSQNQRYRTRILKLLPIKQSVAENFADGKGPGRPGDSQRHGIRKGATMAELEKASHAKGRKGQLARWQLNMRRGHKK